MRAIAQEAGVSVGNAYYYFAGKEHLIQGFYDRIGAEHQAAIRPVLEREKDLEARIAGVLKAWLDVAEPYHEFAAQFFKNAADPESPLSPFSPESAGPREESIAIHREVLAGSKAKVPEELRDVLPEPDVAVADGARPVLGLRPHGGARTQLPARRARRPHHHPGRLTGPLPRPAPARPRGADSAVHGLPGRDDEAAAGSGGSTTG